ncbi:MAG TPA: class II glutamine amidotransferase [bacterium]
MLWRYRPFLLKTCLLIIPVVFAVLVMISRHAEPSRPVPHNCRMWGITTSSMYYGLEVIVRAHLDSLRALGNSNKDGWGITFFTRTDPDTVMPLIERGEPSAPSDPRYELAVNDLIMFLKNTGIAHVRSRSSGPTDIPNPHPFFRKSLRRNLNLLFSHNGTVDTKTLLELIRREDPAYLNSNPPDYPDPNYLDSDLYFLFIVEIIDTHLSESIEQCVRLAVTKIDSALGPPANTSQLNFLMTDGYTLWALRHGWLIPDYYTLYFYPIPQNEPSNFWIAASVPMGIDPGPWCEIPNSCLVTLRPGEKPLLTYIYNQPPCSLTIPVSAALAVHQNPSSRKINATYELAARTQVRITVRNIAGIHVKTIADEWQALGVHTVTWEGKDERGNTVPAGPYFISLEHNGKAMTRKAVLLQ